MPDIRHWPLEATTDPPAQADRLQRDVRAHLRLLDGEAQNHIEVLTGKRLHQKTLPPREVVPPAPVLTALDPSTAELGSPSFTIHVHGVGFTPDDVIIWNGGAEATGFVSPAELTTGVNMETAAYAVPIPIEVSGPGGLSNVLTFTFLEAPAPVLTSLTPATVVIGSPSLTLHVRGTGFTAWLVIFVFNGFDEPTTLVSDTEVTTGINMDVWTAPSLPLPVGVRNANGQMSNTLDFTFTAAR